MKLADSHLLRAGLASFWSYSGRVVGLGWTAALIHQLGIGSYGQYAIGVSGAAIINAAIDNAFFVRSLRLDEERYQRERCARVLFGIAVGVVGVLCYLQWYVAGFAIIVAAGELLFNTYKSQFMRVGRPDVTMRYDAIRQIASIGLAVAYLYTVDGATLYVASALYLLPYLVVLIACVRYVPGHKPAFPGGPREFSLLSSEAFAGGLYAQGDVLIIGWVAGDRVAGYYSVALVAALAISMIGQNYANTYVEKIRAADGHVSSAPARSSIVRAGAFTGASMAAIGVGILVWGGADYTGFVALILSLFVFARAINHSFIVVLFLQHRDSLRVRATVTVAVTKIVALLAVVGTLGGYGAAAAAVVCEFALLVVYYRAIYVGNAPPVVSEPDLPPAFPPDLEAMT
ncbi:lipopolysaccharide biosynthesis protein [Actinomycetes bacterium M1A6_2h]